MITITITEEVETIEDMSDLLQAISFQVQRGYTSGLYPHWSIEKTNEHDTPNLKQYTYEN